MKRCARKKLLSCAVCGLFLLIGSLNRWPTLVGFGQQLGAPRWNPTRVPSGTAFAGAQVCAPCHKEIATTQLKTSMGGALETVAESALLSANPLLTFRGSSYVYEIKRQGNQSIFTVTDGRETLAVPIRYAFGQGKAGQTYVMEYDGAFYEGRVSYYSAIKGLDYTIGTPPAPRTLKEALGRRLSKDETLRCFACHATGAVNGGQLQLDKLTPGIHCEACHGPGGAHVAALKAGQASQAAKLIFNPARLSSDELSQEYCASCHRGSEESTLTRSQAFNNVRFQPYRIFNSKCYSDDPRIGCTACHNPHEAPQQEAAFYDAKCQACHQTSNKAKTSGPSAARCRVGAKNCVSCHMPKLEPPGAHFKFTDHRIRIAKPGEPFPD